MEFKRRKMMQRLQRTKEPNLFDKLDSVVEQVSPTCPQAAGSSCPAALGAVGGTATHNKNTTTGATTQWGNTTRYQE